MSVEQQVAQQIAWWRTNRVPLMTVLEALGFPWQRDVTWQHVECWLIGWARYQEMRPAA